MPISYFPTKFEAGLNFHLLNPPAISYFPTEFPINWVKGAFPSIVSTWYLQEKLDFCTLFWFIKIGFATFYFSIYYIDSLFTVKSVSRIIRKTRFLHDLQQKTVRYNRWKSRPKIYNLDRFSRFGTFLSIPGRLYIYITREREIERERESVCTSMSLKHGMLELGLWNGKVQPQESEKSLVIFRFGSFDLNWPPSPSSWFKLSFHFWEHPHLELSNQRISGEKVRHVPRQGVINAFFLQKRQEIVIDFAGDVAVAVGTGMDVTWLTGMIVEWYFWISSWFLSSASHKETDVHCRRICSQLLGCSGLKRCKNHEQSKAQILVHRISSPRNSWWSRICFWSVSWRLLRPFGCQELRKEPPLVQLGSYHPPIGKSDSNAHQWPPGGPWRWVWLRSRPSWWELGQPTCCRAISR